MSAVKAASFAVVFLGLQVLSFIYTGLLFKNQFVVGATIYKKKTLLEVITEDFGIEKSKIPFICFAIYAFIAYGLTVFIMGVTVAYNSTSSYNNDNPREARKKLIEQKPEVQRVESAHLNSLEQVPLFAATVLICNVLMCPLEIQINLTMLYLFFRILYLAFYYGNMSTLRSFSHMCSLWCLFVLLGVCVGGKGFKEWYEGLAGQFAFFVKSLKFSSAGKTEL